jgi:hypothetical protein
MIWPSPNIPGAAHEVGIQLLNSLRSSRGHCFFHQLKDIAISHVAA